MEHYDCPCKKKNNEVAPFAKSVKTRFDDDESKLATPYRNLDKLKSRSRREQYDTSNIIGDVVVEDPTPLERRKVASPVVPSVTIAAKGGKSSNGKNTLLIVIIIIAICVVVYLLWKRKTGNSITMPKFLKNLHH